MQITMNIQEEIATSHKQALAQAHELEPQVRALLEQTDTVSAPKERLSLLAKAQLLEWHVIALQESLCGYRSELQHQPFPGLGDAHLLSSLDDAHGSLAYHLEGFAELRVKLLAPELPPREEWDPYWDRPRAKANHLG